MRVKYDCDKDVCSELSVSNHDADVLNELDYLNQACVVYRVGSDIYLENSNEVRISRQSVQVDIWRMMI